MNASVQAQTRYAIWALAIVIAIILAFRYKLGFWKGAGAVILGGMAGGALGLLVSPEPPKASS